MPTELPYDRFTQTHPSKLLGAVEWSAWRAVLPAPADRFRPETALARDRWMLRMPGPSAAWDRYVIMPCSLADAEGVPPAHRHFPEATHEITVFAINPDFPDADFVAGAVSLLSPANHVVQVTLPTDEACDWLAMVCAESFVKAVNLIEPQGIMGASERFEAFVRYHAARVPKNFCLTNPDVYNHPVEPKPTGDPFDPTDGVT